MYVEMPRKVAELRAVEEPRRLGVRVPPDDAHPFVVDTPVELIDAILAIDKRQDVFDKRLEALEAVMVAIKDEAFHEFDQALEAIAVQQHLRAKPRSDSEAVPVAG